MAKVKALYSYTYDYEGSKISFKCGDEFLLLAKVNNDWWHVRRWIDLGCAQDIYIPAVYVKEVGEEENPLYQNTAELKRQVEEFKKKESSTPPPPTARKPRHERAGSDKSKTVTTTTTTTIPAATTAKVSENKPGESSESVADLAKKLAETMQGKKSSTEQEVGATAVKAGANSPLVAPKRSQSTRRLESPSSPRHGRKISDGVPNILPVASKPRSHSINTRPGESRRERESVSPPELVLQHGEPPPAAGKSGLVKTKQPPPVLPKGGKLHRPKSMVMFSPTEGVEGGTDDPFAASFQSQLSEQMKKMRSSSSVGASSAATGGVAIGAEPKVVAVKEDAAEKSSSVHSGEPVQNGTAGHDATISPSSPSSFSPPSSLTLHQKHTLPEGWSEYKTNEGHTYYYNSTTGKSSWTRPPSAKKTTPTTSPTQQNGQSADPREKIAPRGWTKEINPLSQTPIYTSSRTGERWALAKDGTGNYYYYNMSNSQMTVTELPDVTDAPSSREKQLKPQQNIYDHISPLSEIESAVERVRTNSDPRAKMAADPTALPPSHSLSQPSPSPSPSPGVGTTTTTSSGGGLLSAQLEVFHHSLAHMQLKKHGYLLRKRLFDVQGKRMKGGWQRVYISLDNFQLKFYTDHKIAMEAGNKTLGTFHLLQATVCTYTKEKKIKHTFVVSSPFGEQFLLQAETGPQMNDWYSTMQTCVHKANEDYKLHPDKYADLHLEGDGEISPKTPLTGKHRRKPSKDILAMEEDEELDDMELSDKSDRIRHRLRRLMARRPQMETLQKKGIIEDPVFGADLAKYCGSKKVLVPQFLVQFMEHIEAHGLSTVGLYRLSGNAASVQKLRCLVEQDTPFNLDDPEWADINIVTGCLKLYFRELPDPLVPANRFQGFIDAARSASTPALRITALAGQVKELPKINYCTLVALMTHLRTVMDNGSVNKMHSQNISIVFGPTLLRAEGDPFEMAKLTPFQNGIVELMLIEFDTIFTRKY